MTISKLNFDLVSFLSPLLETQDPLPLRGATWAEVALARVPDCKPHAGYGLRDSGFGFASAWVRSNAEGFFPCCLEPGAHSQLNAARMRTPTSTFMTGRLEAAHPHATWKQALIHGGDQAYTRQGVSVVPWRDIENLAPK